MASAIILAGGLGTRLRNAVPDVPKPMAPINGRPFLEYQLDYWIKQGISRFVLSLGYRHEIIIDHFGKSYHGVEIDYVIEKTPLGTGGGLLLASKKIGKDEAFLLLNGDTYFTANLKILIEYALENNADWCFSLFRNKVEGRYMGVDVSPQGQILSLKPVTGQPSFFVNGGVYWVNSKALFHCETFSPGKIVSLENDIFTAALGAGQCLVGIEFLGTFIDIGVPEDYYRASALLAN